MMNKIRNLKQLISNSTAIVASTAITVVAVETVNAASAVIWYNPVPKELLEKK